MPAEHTPTTLTPPALHALVSSIIDYAGLFPPARLPLDTAIGNYARYRTEPEAWMLARRLEKGRTSGGCGIAIKCQ